MTKKITETQNRESELLERINQLEKELAAQRSRNSGSQRQQAILDLLRKEPRSVKQLAVELGINVTTRNVSTVLSGLRKAGYVFYTDDQQRKVLVTEPQMD